jgi:hypothetical protein
MILSISGLGTGCGDRIPPSRSVLPSRILPTADVPTIDQSTAGWIFTTLLLISNTCIAATSARSCTLVQIQSRSGNTSHLPNMEPPQGPLRICLGQDCGHTKEVERSTHWPQLWHPNTRFLPHSSTLNSTRYKRLLVQMRLNIAAAQLTHMKVTYLRVSLKQKPQGVKGQRRVHPLLLRQIGRNK